MSQPPRPPVSRRRFLGLGGKVLAGTAVAGSPSTHPAWSVHPAWIAHQAWSARVSADMPAPDAAVHLLSRAAYGATPAELDHLRAVGPAAWIEEQLDHAHIDDTAVEGPLAAGLATLAMDLPALMQHDEHIYRVPDALNAATLYRQAFSPRQLFEVMVDFWTDHFSINQYLDNAQWHKTVDDREVVRRHALGRFQDLVTASARSVAMLHYLNNDENTKAHPNENYAREIMELHTLGVATNGDPYTETDVLETARCFTGWSWVSRQNEPGFGGFKFFADRHDNRSKLVLGQRLPAGGGEHDAEIVIDILCRHPATPRFLATKLVRRFVTDDPVTETPALVDRVAAAYTATDGDIKAMVRAILTSEEFAGSFGRFGGRLTRPMDLVVRMMRATGAPQAGLVPQLADRPAPFHLVPFQLWYRALVGWMGFLNQMGHIPFAWPTPDGYPDRKESWAAAPVMLARWNLGLAFAGGSVVPGFTPHRHRPQDLATPAAVVDYWIETLLHRPMLDADRSLLASFFTDGGRLTLVQAAAQREAQLVALVLDSPYFQWR